MRGEPCKIIRVGKLRYTRDRKYRIGVQFGLMWAAYKGCKCDKQCCCNSAKLPGGVAGTGFNSLKAIQAALRTEYAKAKR